MAQQNALNLGLPVSSQQGGTGINVPSYGNYQFVMGGDNGAQLTRLTAYPGIALDYDANNVYIKNTAVNYWYNYANAGTYQINNQACIIANCKTSNGLVFNPYFQSSDYNKSSRIVGVGSGLFQIQNPGGLTLMIGNKIAPNIIQSNAVGDCIEMISVNSTTFMFIVQQGNFTIS